MPNVSPEAQAIAREVQKLLEGMTVPCEECEAADIGCTHCYPDPRYDGLLAVVQEECTEDVSDIGSHQWCCGETGRRPRDWATQPVGSLEGAIRRNLPGGWRMTSGRSYVDLQGVNGEGWASRVVNGDFDLAAAQVVKTALEAQVKP